MLKSIHELQQLHDKEMSDLIERHECASHLPEPIHDVILASHGVRVRASYVVHSLDLALDLQKRFTVFDPYAVYTKGCTYTELLSIIPDGVAQQASRYQEFCDGTPYLRIRNSGSSGVNGFLSFFTHFQKTSGESFPVLVTITIKNFPVVPRKTPIRRPDAWGRSSVVGYRTDFPVEFEESLRVNWSTYDNSTCDTSFFWTYFEGYDSAMQKLLEMSRFGRCGE